MRYRSCQRGFMSEDDLSAHYASGAEGSRLTRSAHGRLEYLRTQELVRRLLPSPPARVLDVGGGMGVHARWLAEDGYEVHLVDPVVHHVQSASEIRGVSAERGDARDSQLGPEPLTRCCCSVPFITWPGSRTDSWHLANAVAFSVPAAFCSRRPSVVTSPLWNQELVEGSPRVFNRRLIG